MNLLLTGASGFVGGSFWNRFESEIHITGIGRRELNRKNYVRHDLSQPINLSADFRPDVVIHAGAMASPWGTAKQFYRNNVLATRNVVDFCESRSVRKLIYISSSSVYYNDQDQSGITEETPIGPSFINGYARSKFEGELEARRFTGEVVILRPRAVFGPGDTVLFPRILEAARRKKLPVIERPGNPAIGDLIYIDNLTDCMKQAAINASITGDFNLTNNEPVSIQDFLFDVFRRLDIPLPRKRVSGRKALFAATLLESAYRVMRLSGEPPVTRFGVQVFTLSKTFDVTKMLQTFGPPAVSVEEGVRRFIEWQRHL